MIRRHSRRRMAAAVALAIGVSIQAMAAEGSSSATVLTRGEAKVAVEDVDARIEELPLAERVGFASDPDRLGKLLDSLVTNRQLAALARAAGLDKEPNYPTRLRQAEEELLAKRYIASELAKAEMPEFDQAAREQYDARIEDFTSPESVSVTHILVDLNGRTDEQARQRAEEARAKAIAGEPFGDLVAQYSNERDKERSGGNLKKVTQKGFDPAFAEAAFAMSNAGEISPVVKTRFGYHVIRFDSRKPANTHPFETVKPVIVKRLKEQYLKAENARILQRVQMQEQTVDAEVFNQLRSRYSPR